MSFLTGIFSGGQQAPGTAFGGGQQAPATAAAPVLGSSNEAAGNATQEARTSNSPTNTTFVKQGTHLTLVAPWLSRNCHPAILSGKPVNLIFTGDGLSFGEMTPGAPTSDRLILNQPGTREKVAGTFQLVASGLKHTDVQFSNEGAANIQARYVGNNSHLDIIVDGQVVANFDLQTLNPNEGQYYGRPMNTRIYFDRTDVAVIQTPQTSMFEDCRDTASACPRNALGCATAVARTVVWPFRAAASTVIRLLPDRSAQKAPAMDTNTGNEETHGEASPTDPNAYDVEAGFESVNPDNKKDN